VSITSSRAGFATLELTHRLIKNLQRPGHLQTDQGLANAVEDRGDDSATPTAASHSTSLASLAIAFQAATRGRRAAGPARDDRGP
jgi:hypothetical protein